VVFRLWTAGVGTVLSPGLGSLYGSLALKSGYGSGLDDSLREAEEKISVNSLFLRWVDGFPPDRCQRDDA